MFERHTEVFSKWVSVNLSNPIFLKSSFEGGYYRDNWTRKSKTNRIAPLLNTIQIYP
jgi:hypothetical protein